ncbi:MAG: carboxypeptidase [Verrucomicrobia bacterium]|nr:carboxypeptidase [Verrucomicrobiota bacterium]
MSHETVYAELTDWIKRVHALGSVGELLAWDEQVNLPPGAAEQRASQLAALAGAQHAAASDPRIGAWLTALEGEAASLTADQKAVVKNARRDFDRATKLPEEFVREKAAQGSRGYHAWARAKAGDDFASYAPVLARNLELAKREAGYLDWAGREYDYMVDKHDPGMTAAVIGGLFDELKRDLVPLVKAIAASKLKPRSDALRGFPIDGQRAFLREVTQRLGFDYDRGRIDVSLHPFCTGTGSDVRMTTRFKEDEPLDSLFSAIHETGHGLYEQGLRADQLGTALGIHAGMAVHESQSRLWENQVARSRGFWRCFEPRLRELFPRQTQGVSSDELYLAINAVTPTLIRVDADEVTYNLHIILRFELEKKLFTGALAIGDLPAAWRESAEGLLGLTPPNDREGVLQDVHWSDGAFGYFPSYCLGNMLAAQLWYRALSLRPDLEKDFAGGDFTWLLGWLRENIHAQGRRFDALQLARRVTGEELSPRHLVRYLRERYGRLYGAEGEKGWVERAEG